MSRIRRWASVATGVVSTAVAGSLASSRGASSEWYADLEKPAFQPPAAAFPVVWTVLYAGIIAGSGTALDRLDDDDRRSYAGALGANLVLNAGWSWVFFRWHRLGPAVAVASALTASSADLARRTRSVAPGTARALDGYAAWCGFATVLSVAIWRRNR